MNMMMDQNQKPDSASSSVCAFANAEDPELIAALNLAVNRSMNIRMTMPLAMSNPIPNVDASESYKSVPVHEPIVVVDSSASSSTVSALEPEADLVSESEPTRLAPGSPQSFSYSFSIRGHAMQLRSGLEVTHAELSEFRFKKSKIQLGENYQASIPDLISLPNDSLVNRPPGEEQERLEKLLWDPFVLTEDHVKQYLALFTNISRGDNKGLQRIDRDDEQALFTLVKCGYNVEEALNTLSNDLMTYCFPTFTTCRMWSEHETQNFEAGIKTLGKDFSKIQQNYIPTRTFKEVIEFYYFWKKTERRDVIGLRKEKMNLDGDATDFMESFMDDFF